MTFAILMEPMKILIKYLMKAARTNQAAAQEHWPPILDALNPRASVVYAILQYYSTILTRPSMCGRLVLIFSQRGVRSFSEWHLSFPNDIALLRGGALLMIASLERRQWQHLARKYGAIPPKSKAWRGYNVAVTN